MTEALPPHHCPGCGAALEASPRYPWRFCNTCLGTATDSAGRPVELANTGLGGGLGWRPAGSTMPLREVGTLYALILGRPVRIREDRFGGVVAEPCGDEDGIALSRDAEDLRRPG